jgi:hypothetical protein
MKSTWWIINEERGKTKSGSDIQSLVSDHNIITDQNQIANIFHLLLINSGINQFKQQQTWLTQLIIYQTVLENPLQK